MCKELINFIFKVQPLHFHQQVEESSEIASVGPPSGLTRSIRRPISISTNKLSKITEENSEEKSSSDFQEFVNKHNFGCDFDKITCDTCNSSRDMNDLLGKNMLNNMLKFEDVGACDDISNNIFADKALAGDDDENDKNIPVENSQPSFRNSRFLPEFMDMNKISIV